MASRARATPCAPRSVGESIVCLCRFAFCLNREREAAQISIGGADRERMAVSGSLIGSSFSIEISCEAFFDVANRARKAVRSVVASRLTCRPSCALVRDKFSNLAVKVLWRVRSSVSKPVEGCLDLQRSAAFGDAVLSGGTFRRLTRVLEERSLGT